MNPPLFPSRRILQCYRGGTCILYPVETLPLERLTKSGREGQIIVLSSDLNNKLNRVLQLGLLTNECLPAHLESLVTRSHLQSNQPPVLPCTAEPHQKERWRTPPCQLAHYSRLSVDYISPLPKYNSKQIRHSICLGQLPQTVKYSNKNTR